MVIVQANVFITEIAINNTTCYGGRRPSLGECARGPCMCSPSFLFCCKQYHFSKSNRTHTMDIRMAITITRKTCEAQVRVSQSCDAGWLCEAKGDISRLRKGVRVGVLWPRLGLHAKPSLFNYFPYLVSYGSWVNNIFTYTSELILILLLFFIMLLPVL